jgi:hypothetical protein
MSLCPNCKVEVGNSVHHCPLCHALIQPGDSPPPTHHAYPEQVLDPDDRDKLTIREKHQIFLELYSGCSLIAAVVVLAIDILVDRRLSWSLYPLVSFAYLWLLVCMPVILTGHPWLIFAVLSPSSLLFLFLLDAIDGRMEWFYPVGLALGLLFAGAVAACCVLTALAKRKGINVIAIFLTGAVLFSVGVDIILNLNLKHGLLLSWSAIVLIAGLPSAGFLFFMHYRIVHRASLRKLFHL